MKSECNEFYSQLCKQTKLISHDYFALIKIHKQTALTNVFSELKILISSHFTFRY